MLPVAVARSSSDAMCYVLPVLWMTHAMFSHIVGQVNCSRMKHDVMFRPVCQVASQCKIFNLSAVQRFVGRNLHDAVGDELSIVTSMWDTRTDRSDQWLFSLNRQSPGRRPFSAPPPPPPQLPKDWLGIISAGLLYVFCVRTHNGQIYYPHMPIGKVWIYRLLFVFVCLFVRLRISPARIKLAASNFAWWFMGVMGRESPILGNFVPPEAQNLTNRPATAK